MTFLIAWELMSLASYFLVLHDRDDPESVDAAWLYAVMSQAGLACLLAGMLLLTAATGSATFADWASAAPDLAPGARVLPLLLLGLGFASKAGVIPLHVWLPRAHPAAPSHVSALMSGVMVKLGIYGLVRASLDWLAPTPVWWGAAVLLAGAVSAVVGILYAVVERDLKRLLAFSSIENVGVILIGLGAGLVFRGVGLGGLAVLAIAAALYHAVNHAAFKSLLFLGAGAVVHATGTRNMNALGGLVTRMPWTAACFVFGAAAIAALPPLNGFVSEWLIFQALLQNVQMARLELNLTFTFGLAALALTSGLTLACFVKAAGITFLAVPRSDAAARAHEAPVSMRAAMVLLAGACVFLGLGPTLVLPALARLAGPLVGAELPALGDGLTVRISGEFAALSPGRPDRGPRGRPARPAGRAPAPPRAAPDAVVRDLGLRPDAPDGAHGVHRDGVLESLQACLRLLLPAREASGHRVPSRLPLLRRADRVREPHPPALRGVALRAGAGRALPRRGPHASACSRAAPTRISRTSWPRCCCSWCWRDRRPGPGPDPGAGRRRRRPAPGRRAAHAQGAAGRTAGSASVAAVRRPGQAPAQGGGGLDDDVVGLPRDALRAVRHDAGRRGDRAGRGLAHGAAVRRDHSPDVPLPRRKLLPGPGRPRLRQRLRRHGRQPRGGGRRAGRADGDSRRLRAGPACGHDEPRRHRGPPRPASQAWRPAPATSSPSPPSSS